MSFFAVRRAAEAHNANPAYRAAGYPLLVTHVAVLRAASRSPVTVFFNVLEGEDAAERLRVIHSLARLETTQITRAETDTVLAAPQGE